VDPRGGGRTKIENSSKRHPRKSALKLFLVVRNARAEGVACFGLPPWKKIIGGVIAIISFRPGGWMQQSTVPRCAILSVGSTGDTSCEAARLHWAYRRRGGDMAARGGRAAGRDAGRRPSRSDNGPGIRGAGGAVSVRRKAEKIRRPFPTASDHFI